MEANVKLFKDIRYVVVLVCLLVQHVKFVCFNIDFGLFIVYKNSFKIFFKDNNPCSSSPCLNNGVCSVNPSTCSFICECQPGYTGSCCATRKDN